jgi:hypothetical protein
MIAILGWQDGFGCDTCVIGIFNSVEDARKVFNKEYNEHETRYQEISLNTLQDFDWYDAKPLFSKNKSKKRGR